MKLDKNYIIAYWITFTSYIAAFAVLMLTIGYDYNLMLSNVWLKRAGLIVMLAGWIIWYIGRKKLGHDSIDIDPLGEIARIIFHPGRKRERHSPKDVVNTGIYKITRHPQYWGTVLFYIGLGVALESIFGLIAALIIVLPTHIWRAIVEERMLISAWGEKYLQYKQQVRI